MFVRVVHTTILILLWIPSIWAQSAGAYRIVEKAHNNRFISNFQAQAEMTVYRPTWQRTIGIKTWLRSREMVMLLIVSPPKEKGQSYLKKGDNIWSWQPVIERTVKIAISAAGASWQGSDFTIDDMMNTTSFLHDFTHELLGEEEVEGDLCNKLLLTPHSESATLWSKVIVWISKISFVERKIEYYDENGALIRTYFADNVKKIKEHYIPLHLEVIPAGKEGYKTIVTILDWDYDTPFKESFFSLQNMRRLN